jgi:hypothetical protein
MALHNGVWFGRWLCGALYPISLLGISISLSSHIGPMTHGWSSMTCSAREKDKVNLKF